MSLTDLHGVGPAIAQRLAHLQIQHQVDLLYYFPTRYDDYSVITPIADSPEATTVTVCGTITKITNRRSWQRRHFTVTEATLTDDSDKITVIWFNQPYIAEQLKVGLRYYLSGKIIVYRKKRVLSNPVYELVKSDTLHTARIVPHYALTEGITQKQLRYFISQALRTTTVVDWVPSHILEHYQLIPLAQALQWIHFPNSWEELAQAKQRLSFDELLIVQLFVQSSKAALAKEQAYSVPFPEIAVKNFVQQLPFTLTTDQKRAAWQIMQDLHQPSPMHRLLEGDVGAGKTMVATLAMYTVALAGYQAVLMAPTALLAEQHFKTITALLKNTGVTVGLWTSSKKIQPPNPLKGEIVIGTHALIQKNVQFKKLALAVIDEQHRFGVSQRQHLRYNLGATAFTPHLLSMTATPIPRSLALVLYGDLEISLLQQSPQGRKPIITQLITPSQRKNLYQTLAHYLQNQAQIYVVAPRIDDVSDMETDRNPSLQDDIASVEREYKNLQKHFPNAKISCLHGQLSAEDKDQIMTQFRNREIDILVTTTVIEVGVDVPNATVMVIEGAEQFGLAQLHQLRGRVGRSDQQSYCYVCTATPIPRLTYFVKNNDGFALAEYDLKQRGPGAVYGQDQSGYFNQFKLASLNDHTLVATVKTVAADIFSHLKEYPLMQAKLDQFTHQVHLE